MPIVRFGVFEIDAESGELRKRGLRLRLRDQPLRLLLALAENAGRVVTREQLRHQLWPDGTFVDFDRAINKAVSELRGALGDDPSSPRFIETLSKRGYRFLAAVEHGRNSALAWEPGGVESDAHLACVRGRYLWNRRTVADLHSSIRYFERALEIDSTCTLAHAGLADTHLLLGIWGLRPPDAAFGAARRAATRALEREPELAEAHTSLAEVLTAYERDWRQAELRYQHALSLRPEYATAHQFYAQMLVCLGRHSKAAFHIEQARRADPVSPAINSFLPYIYLAARQYGRALEEARRAVDLEPHAPLAHWTLGRTYLFSNHVEDAVSDPGVRSGAGRAGIDVDGGAELRPRPRRESVGRHEAPLAIDRTWTRSVRLRVRSRDRVHRRRGLPVRSRSSRAGVHSTRDADRQSRRSRVRWLTAGARATGACSTACACPLRTRLGYSSASSAVNPATQALD